MSHTIGYAQNFWVDGTPHWTGVQLDEVALPILLAWYLRREGALRDLDPYPMIAKGAGYLIRHGPATQQARWEEAGGFSPTTLAVSIGALICAADFAHERGDEETARFLGQYADFLNTHVETWTVTTEGTLAPEIPRHFIRILPSGTDDAHPNEDPDHGTISLANQPPGARRDYPARGIVGTGFLALVRLGLCAPDDPLIVNSLRVVDAVLKVGTPFGPCWHRYNHGGYGQRDDGVPYKDWGVGRAWPLLTAERGQYEVAAGHDAGHLIRALEGFATNTGLLPEQIWDAPDLPEAGMALGRPTDQRCRCSGRTAGMSSCSDPRGTERHSRRSSRSPDATAGQAHRTRGWRSGSTTGRCARSRKGTPCASWPAIPSGYAGPGTGGRPWRKRPQRRP